MTTISTMEDLIRTLDGSPEWLEELRIRLLGRELIELPGRFDKFVEEVNRRFDEAAAEVNRRFDEAAAETNRRFDEAAAETNRRFDEAAAETNQRFERVESAIQSLRNDVGNLKGWQAQDIARRQAFRIAAKMGFKLVKVLSLEEIDSLVQDKDTSGIPSNHLDSFLVADQFMEVKDGNGETAYIAVEASYTLDDRDTDRAMRNAGFLTRFTGRPAFAAVAGVRLDERIRAVIESGDVFWHEIEDRDSRVQ